MNKPLSTSVAALIAFTLTAFGANIPLQQATVNRIINDVKVVDPKCGTHPAKITDVIKDDIGVKTGVKSRCELLFQDNTLTRLGSETYFSFKPGTREMTLTEGTMLLQVPKNQGGATIRTASVTASITGTTVMLEHRRDKSIKFLVLEGSMRVGTGRLGENISLTPGKMLIINPRDKRLPDPVNVDLKKLIKTSSLVNPSGFQGSKSGNAKDAALPSMPLINQAIKEQDLLRSKGQLQETNLAILGKGTGVVVADSEMMTKLEEQSNAMSQMAATQPTIPTPVTETPTLIGTKPATDSVIASNNSSNGFTPLTTGTGLGNGDMSGNTPEEILNSGNGSSSSSENSDDVGNRGDDVFDVESGGSDSETSEEITDAVKPDLIVSPPNLLPNPTLENSAVNSTPDWTKTASGGPVPTMNRLPTPLAVTDFQNPSISLLGNMPILAAGGVNYIGTTYSGAANDGSASWFLLGGMTDFEAQIGFDKLIGYGNGTEFPTAGIAVFKSANLNFAGDISAQAGEMRDVAFVAADSIKTKPDGAQFDLSGLRSATFATETGNITIGANSTISSSGDLFEFLHLHSRGGEKLKKNDSIQIEGSINLPNASLIATGNEDVSFRVGSNVNVKDAFIFAGDEAELLGNLTASNATIYSPEAAQFAGTVSIGNLTVHSKDFEVRRGSLTVDTAVLNLSGNYYPGGKQSVTIIGDLQHPDTEPKFAFRELTINALGDVALNQNSTERARLDFTNAETFAVNRAARVIISGGAFEIPDSVDAVLDVVSVNSKSSNTSVSGFDLIKTSGNLDSASVNATDLQIGGNINSVGIIQASTATVGGSIVGDTLNIGKAIVGGNVEAKNRMTTDNLTVGGNVKGKEYVLGTATVGGSVNTSGAFKAQTLTVSGNLATADLDVRSANIGGSATIRGDLSFSSFSTNGSLAVSGSIKPSSLNSPSATSHLMATSVKAGGGLQFAGESGESGRDGGILHISSPDAASANTSGIAFGNWGIKGAKFDGGDSIGSEKAGGSGGTLLIGTEERPFSGIVTVDSKISATTGKNGENVSFGGNGGTVGIDATGKVTLKGEIQVSSSASQAASKNGGNILISSRKTSETAIEISNTAQLNSLLSSASNGDGGRIEFKSAGGLIVANGGKIQADRGSVEIKNTGTGGNIALNNTQISADTVKIATLGANGTLTIGGGVIKANTLLNLYAAGSNGTILFKDNTKLDGYSLKTIAANTVTIANGKKVEIGGLLPATVLTNNANYTGSGGNGSTSGKFEGRGAIRLPLGNASSY
jgi:cytoskeletal protein CcmA (bactofilin family)